MSPRLCSKCNTEKELSEFNLRNKQKNKYHSFCKACHSAYRRIHYVQHRVKYLEKAKSWNKKQTRVLRAFIYKYLSENFCKDCGQKDIRVLDFDHEGDKAKGICVMIRACHSVDSIKKEIEKCTVRCANCHRIKTFVRGNFWKNKMGL